jgi:hypothetical protein
MVETNRTMRTEQHMTATKRWGREHVKGTRGKKSTIGVRVAHALKGFLNDESARNDRPLSQEAELILEAHVARRRSLLDALDLVYGREAAGLMLHIGEMAIDVQHGAGRAISDRWTFDELVKAIMAELERIRPPGESVPPASGSTSASGWPDFERELLKNHGLNVANAVHRSVFGDKRRGEREMAIKQRLTWAGGTQ